MPLIAKDLALRVLGALALGGTVVGGGLAISNLKGGEENNRVLEDKSSTVTTGNTSQGEKKQENQTHSDGGQGVKGDGGAGGKGVTNGGPEINERAQENSLGPVGKEVPDRAQEDSPGGPPEPGIPEVKVKALEEMGLNCGEDNICSLITGKTLTVKQDNKTRTLTALPAAGQGVGKIKISRSQDGDETRSALNIEGGDITPTWGDGDTSITKLEEFETYEVEGVPEGSGKKYYFKRRSTANKEIEMKLGLDNKCTLPTSSTEAKSCTITSIELTSMNFEGKKNEESPSINENGSTTLTITKLKKDVDKDYSKYPFGYQFVLSGDKEVKIPATPEEIVKNAKVSLGFKIKVTPETGGPKTLTLEKVSQIDRLAWKLGLRDCNTQATTCKFSEKINVYKDGKENIKDGKITNLTDQIITYQENADGYEGGIKFTVSKEISFAKETIKGTFSRIESGDYEAKEQTVNGQKHWYLSKKPS